MTQALNIKLRDAAETRRRRPWLVCALALSLAAHIGLAAMLWIEQPPQPGAGAVVGVEIVSVAGAARSSPANAAHGGPARVAHQPTKPETAPAPKAVEALEAPRTARVPAPSAPPLDEAPQPPVPERATEAPAAPTALQRPEPVPPIRSTPATAAPKPAAPATAVERPALQLALRRPAPIPPPAESPRRAAPPSPSTASPARSTDAGRTARGQTASAPIVAADAAPGAAAPGAGPETGATPPRYGFGSAANPIPRYPETARARGWEGLVLLSVRVAADGQAESVSVSQSSGHSLLDDAAVDAARRWRFEPARRAGTPVAGIAIVPIRFRLED